MGLDLSFSSIDEYNQSELTEFVQKLICWIEFVAKLFE